MTTVNDEFKENEEVKQKQKKKITIYHKASRSVLAS